MRERVFVAEAGQEARARTAPVVPPVHAILALQRASGNYATTQLLRARTGASSAPGYTGGEDDYEDEFDEFDDDDETSQYLWKPHPITLGDFMGPALAEMEKRDAEARAKARAAAKAARAAAKAKARAEAKETKRAADKAKGKVAQTAHRKQLLEQLLRPHIGDISRLTALGYPHDEFRELTAWKHRLASSKFTTEGFDVEIELVQNQLPRILRAAKATEKRLIALQPTYTSLVQDCNTLTADLKVFDLACRKFEAFGCNPQRLLTHLSITVPGIQLLPVTCQQLVQSCTTLLATVNTYHVDEAEAASTYFVEQITTCMATVTSAIRILDSCRFIRCAPNVLNRLLGVTLFNTCELATTGTTYSGNNRHHLKFGLKGWESIRGAGGAIVIFRFNDGVLEIGNTGRHESAGSKSTYVLDEGNVPQTDFTDVLLFEDEAGEFHLDAMKK